jgi:hypothetical protein
MLIHYMADNARVRLLIVPTSRAEKVKHIFFVIYQDSKCHINKPKQHQSFFLLDEEDKASRDDASFLELFFLGFSLLLSSFNP